MDKKERLIRVLEDLDSDELVKIHNEYCEKCNYPDDEIFNMDDFEEIIGNPSYMTLAQMIYCGNFNPNEKYWWYDSYGNIKSADYPESNYGDQQIYISDIANAMICEEDGFGNDECQEIIDEDDEEDEEE